MVLFNNLELKSNTTFCFLSISDRHEIEKFFIAHELELILMFLSSNNHIDHRLLFSAIDQLVFIYVYE